MHWPDIVQPCVRTGWPLTGTGVRRGKPLAVANVVQSVAIGRWAARVYSASCMLAVAYLLPNPLFEKADHEFAYVCVLAMRGPQVACSVALVLARGCSDLVYLLAGVSNAWASRRLFAKPCARKCSA